MPFTPAHAVVALPFIRTPLPPAAIAIGAMAPDIPLFFRFGPDYWVTHSWSGVLLVDVPLALFLLLVWRILLRPAVAQLTPRWFARRWPASWSEVNSGWWELWGGRVARARTRWLSALLLLAALAIGSASHVVWDSFTHGDRFGSNLLPLLDSRVGPFPLWAWGHYVSSVLGLGIIAIWGYRWLARQQPAAFEYSTPTWMRVAAWLALPVSLLAGATALVAVKLGPEVASMRRFLERSGTTGAAIFLVVLVVLAITARIAMTRHARDAP